MCVHTIRQECELVALFIEYPIHQLVLQLLQREDNLKQNGWMHCHLVYKLFCYHQVTCLSLPVKMCLTIMLSDELLVTGRFHFHGLATGQYIEVALGFVDCKQQQSVRWLPQFQQSQALTKNRH